MYLRRTSWELPRLSLVNIIVSDEVIRERLCRDPLPEIVVYKNLISGVEHVPHWELIGLAFNWV